MTLEKQELIRMWFRSWNTPGWLRLRALCQPDLDKGDISNLEQIDENAIGYIKEAEIEWRKDLFEKARTNKKEMEKEENKEELQKLRIEGIDSNIEKLEKQLELIESNFEDSKQRDITWFLRRAVLDINEPEEFKKKIRKLSMEKYILLHPEDIAKFDRITPQEIESALSFPFNQLIEFNRVGSALCPFHSEKTPSFHFFKNSNRAYCFGCQGSWDTIAFVMQKENLSFPKAVRRLLL